MSGVAPTDDGAPTGTLEEVRRESDGELEGHVTEGRDGWQALTVFGGHLATVADRLEAEAVVHQRGLSSLAERWYWWSRIAGAWQVVLPQEASPGRVRVAVGYYSLPGVETATITADDLAAGDRLMLAPPADAEGQAPT